jgi:hypothetical protein
MNASVMTGTECTRLAHASVSAISQQPCGSSPFFFTVTPLFLFKKKKKKKRRRRRNTGE